MPIFQPVHLTPDLAAAVERWTRLAGWSRLHVRSVERFWRRLGEPQPFRLIDVGCGLGGLLEDVHAWAERAGIEVELAGCEISKELVDAAAERLGDRAFIYQGDLQHLGCGADVWHLATCCLVTSQLSGHDKIRLVTELGRVARTAYIFDVSKTAATEVGAKLVPLLSRGGVGPPEAWVTSVDNAATQRELRDLVSALPVDVVSVFPGAMCTVPEAAKRQRIERPESKPVRVKFESVALAPGLAGADKRHDVRAG
ncbi:MAG: ubiquinone/menaquinone biosynthesis C-methylase UbiE [Kiritimatiellia bacterium]|jgi:ubiquinone/menaquinone biosynthesis C-methylase UbiE